MAQVNRQKDSHPPGGCASLFYYSSEKQLLFSEPVFFPIVRGGILYRQPFKSRCLSLPGNKKAPYCYDAFVLLGSWSKGTLFNYLLYFFFLLTTVVPMAAPPLTNSRANHKARLLLSPVSGESIGLAVPFVPVPALPLFLLH